MSDDLFDTADGVEGPGGELPKDQWGRYRLPTPGGDGKLSGRTRVTTFAKSISDTFVLSQWQQRMAMKGLMMRPDLQAMVAATSLDDRDTLNRLAEDAKNAAAARAAANLGTAMHAFGEEADRTGKMPANIPLALRPILAARQKALADRQIVMVPEMIERTVYVPMFDVAGTFDRWGWAEWNKPDMLPNVDLDPGEIMDDKTGRDLTYGQTEIAIQLACYANASHVLNKARYWETLKRGPGGQPVWADPDCWEPMPPTRKDRALVIWMPVAAAMDSPTEPPQVTIFPVDIVEGWNAAQLCADVRAWRKRRNLFGPALSVTVPTRHDTLTAAVERELEVPLNSDLGGVGLAAARADLNQAEQVLAMPNVPDDVAADAMDRAAKAAAVIEFSKKVARPIRAAGTGCCGGWVGPDRPERCTECPAPDGWHPGKLDVGVTSEMVTRPPTWEERVMAATSQGDLSKIWREATKAGEWTSDLEKLGMAQMSKFQTA